MFIVRNAPISSQLLFKFVICDVKDKVKLINVPLVEYHQFDALCVVIEVVIVERPEKKNKLLRTQI